MAINIFKTNALPMIILGVVMALMILNQAGYIDLPKAGQQIKAVFDKTDDETPDIQTVKLNDGVVGKPYYDSITKYITKCTPTCKKYYTDTVLPQDLEMNIDGSINGIPQWAGTGTFGMCFEDTEGGEACLDAVEFSITIKPKEEPKKTPVREDCPIKPNPTCGSQPEGKGDLMPTTVGTLSYEGCECPEGTHDSGGRDAITTPGTVYMMCLCD